MPTRTTRSGAMTTKPKSGTKIAVAKKSLKVQIGAPRSGAGGQALPFSPAIRAGDFVYVSGQVAHDENGELVDGGIIKQTQQTIEKMSSNLDKAGCTLDDVHKCKV